MNNNDIFDYDEYLREQEEKNKPGKKGFGALFSSDKKTKKPDSGSKRKEASPKVKPLSGDRHTASVMSSSQTNNKIQTRPATPYDDENIIGKPRPISQPVRTDTYPAVQPLQQTNMSQSVSEHKKTMTASGLSDSNDYLRSTTSDGSYRTLRDSRETYIRAQDFSDDIVSTPRPIRKQPAEVESNVKAAASQLTPQPEKVPVLTAKPASEEVKPSAPKREQSVQTKKTTAEEFFNPELPLRGQTTAKPEIKQPKPALEEVKPSAPKREQSVLTEKTAVNKASEPLQSSYKKPLRENKKDNISMHDFDAYFGKVKTSAIQDKSVKPSADDVVKKEKAPSKIPFQPKPEIVPKGLTVDEILEMQDKRRGAAEQPKPSFEGVASQTQRKEKSVKSDKPLSETIYNPELPLRSQTSSKTDVKQAHGTKAAPVQKAEKLTSLNEYFSTDTVRKNTHDDGVPKNQPQREKYSAADIIRNRLREERKTLIYDNQPSEKQDSLGAFESTPSIPMPEKPAMPKFVNEEVPELPDKLKASASKSTSDERSKDIRFPSAAKIHSIDNEAIETVVSTEQINAADKTEQLVTDRFKSFPSFGKKTEAKAEEKPETAPQVEETLAEGVKPIEAVKEVQPEKAEDITAEASQPVVEIVTEQPTAEEHAEQSEEKTEKRKPFLLFGKKTEAKAEEKPETALHVEEKVAKDVKPIEAVKEYVAPVQTEKAEVSQPVVEIVTEQPTAEEHAEQLDEKAEKRKPFLLFGKKGETKSEEKPETAPQVEETLAEDVKLIEAVKEDVASIHPEKSEDVAVDTVPEIVTEQPTADEHAEQSDEKTEKRKPFLLFGKKGEAKAEEKPETAPQVEETLAEDVKPIEAVKEVQPEKAEDITVDTVPETITEQPTADEHAEQSEEKAEKRKPFLLFGKKGETKSEEKPETAPHVEETLAEDVKPIEAVKEVQPEKSEDITVDTVPETITEQPTADEHAEQSDEKTEKRKPFLLFGKKGEAKAEEKPEIAPQVEETLAEDVKPIEAVKEDVAPIHPEKAEDVPTETVQESASNAPEKQSEHLSKIEINIPKHASVEYVTDITTEKNLEITQNVYETTEAVSQKAAYETSDEISPVIPSDELENVERENEKHVGRRKKKKSRKAEKRAQREAEAKLKAELANVNTEEKTENKIDEKSDESKAIEEKSELPFSGFDFSDVTVEGSDETKDKSTKKKFSFTNLFKRKEPPKDVYADTDELIEMLNSNDITAVDTSKSAKKKGKPVEVKPIQSDKKAEKATEVKPIQSDKKAEKAAEVKPIQPDKKAEKAAEVKPIQPDKKAEKTAEVKPIQSDKKAERVAEVKPIQPDKKAEKTTEVKPIQPDKKAEKTAEVMPIQPDKKAEKATEVKLIQPDKKAEKAAEVKPIHPDKTPKAYEQIDNIKKVFDNALDENVADIAEVPTEIDFEEAKPKKLGFKRKLYFRVGIAVLVMSFIGLAGAGKIIFNIAADFTKNTQQKESFEKIIYPVVLCDPTSFNQALKLSDETMLTAAIWDILIYDDLTRYEQELGVHTIPAVDVENHVAKLFGGGLKYTHLTIENDNWQFYYDKSLKSYTITSIPQYFTYSPKVEDIENHGDTYFLRVAYIPPTPDWASVNSGEAQKPEKYMTYELVKNGKNYTLVSITEIENENGDEDGL